ncbi:hypothetical protein E0500_042775 [Streptomyces sp. KM273126]|uniref:hypothetical protein n=1 Tax=Streptomyces sp. KM273126 TaxID=2545247 RepID=UPI00103E375A|nr:hypothetical protein [Streptomyces sp. KM273126]MBA2813859.1 hypothetical protein [Streptomyces sp. KM273126]
MRIRTIVAATALTIAAFTGTAGTALADDNNQFCGNTVALLAIPINLLSNQNVVCVAGER